MSVAAFSPRDSADVANSANHAGVRWAETIWHSCGTPNCVSVSSSIRRVACPIRCTER